MTLETYAAWLDPLHEGFVEALRSNNLEALGDFYAEDAILLPPGRTNIMGRTQIVAFWKDAERIQDLSFKATAILSIGSEAVREGGELTVTLGAEGRRASANPTKYVAIWLKTDGGWKIDSMAWNSTGVPKGGRGRRGGGRRGQGKQIGAGGKRRQGAGRG